MPLHRWRDIEAAMFPEPSAGLPPYPQPKPAAFQLVPLPSHLPPVVLAALKALYEQAYAAALADAQAAKQLDRLRPHWN